MSLLRSKPSLILLLTACALAVGWLVEPEILAESANPTTQLIATKPHPQVDDKALMARWNKDIKPMLEHYCYDCHGDGHNKAKLDFDDYPDLASMRKNPKIWEHVQARIDYHLMPPPNKEQPERKERDQLIHWINETIFPIDPNHPDPGHVVIRRMNRIEYQNTIRDLLGVSINAAALLPPDDSGHGFDNIGSVLTISPAHIEKYLYAAELALDKAIVIGPMKPLIQKLDPQKFHGDGKRSEDGVYLFKNGTVQINAGTSRQGSYRLHVIASAQQAGGEPAYIDVRLKGKRIKRFNVANHFRDEKKFSLKLHLEKGDQNISLTFPNDYYNPDAPDPKKRDRNLMIHAVQLEGPLGVAHEKPLSHRRIFIPRKKGSDHITYARQVLTKFAQRAYRRPVSKDEISHYLKLVEHMNRQEKSLEAGIKGALQAMLVSPSFLFLGDARLHDKAQKPATTLISEHTLASRLSYFLWSSMPDDQLLRLASSGRLRANLNQQVLRMLKDERAKQLVKNFSGQWLQLRDLDVVTPDRKRFSAFNDSLRQDMKTETEMLVDHLLRGNRNLMDFIDADYSFINDRLAHHYQIEGVAGAHFRKTKLNNSRRRGMLTHASLLTITSQPTRTSAVLRGKFVLENILDITPPPPPPDLPSLDDQKVHGKRLTLREQLELHREKTACAGCHNLMDPVGFAFEHFDAIGRFREFENGRAIDASGQLVTGEKLENADSLRRVISENKRDEFIRCLTVKLMTYALGRGVTRYDRLTVEKILRDIKNNDYTSNALILGIIHSTPFQHQRLY